MDRMDAMLDRHAQMIVDQDMRHQHSMDRLDRIDAMIERQVLANEVAHDEFKAGYKSLLSAQILMNGAMEKMAVKMEETTDKLNGLIATVDGFIQGGARG